MKTLYCKFTRKLLALFTTIAFAALSLQAEDIFVPAYKGATGGADVTPAPICEFPAAGSGVSLSGSSASSSVTPVPLLPNSSRRAVFGNTVGAFWKVTPTDQVVNGSAGDVTFSSLQNIGVYKIYVTKGTSGNASPDLVVDMTAIGGDLADTNGVGAGSIPLAAFQAGHPNNTWIFVGYITNSINSPTITFTYVSGTIASTGGRWYMDAVYFQYLDACTPDGVPVAPQVGVSGPLAQGQTFVNVTGVSEGATNVTAYAGGIEVGQTNYANGFTAGSVTVPTGVLNKGDIITARQSKNGCDSTVPGSGPIVGGGPNTSIKAFLSCYLNAANAGPIGANGFTAGNPYILKATGFIASFNTAPLPGQQLLPSACWQTVTFSHSADTAVDMNSGAGVVDSNPFCALDALVFSIDDTDSGPYEIYVDQIMNGDTVVEDFEGYAVDSISTLVAPNQSAVFAPASTYLATPNSATISADYAYAGTQSSRIRWQWANASNQRWARVVASGASGGKVYPQLDTTKPITIRYLVLPAGETTAHTFNGTVSGITNNPTSYATDTNTLGVTVTGSGTYTYQWSLNGGGLFNPSTEATYLIDGFGAGLSPADNGVYTVTISDGTCTEIRSYSLTVLDPIPTVTNQPVSAVINEGVTAGVLSVGADGHVPSGYPLTYQWRSNSVDIPDQTLATLWITNASLADVLSYDVVVGNVYGSTTSAVATLSVVPAGIVAGTGTGLRGDYRTARFSTNAFSGPPTLTRTDATVNFNFGSGSPGPGLSPNNFTVRWAGQIQALGNDTYSFVTRTDDGVRLWVNGELLIDRWINQAPTAWTNSIVLSGMEKYDVVMEYYEAAGDAVAELNWYNASGTVAYGPVPQSQLYPADAGVVIPTVTHSQPDATHITFNWGAGTYNLAWATDIAGPYTNIIYGVTSPHTVTIGNEPQKYFRLFVQ